MILKIPLPKLNFEELLQTLNGADAEVEIWNAILIARNSIENLSPDQCIQIRKVYWQKLAGKIRCDAPFGRVAEAIDWTRLSLEQPIFKHLSHSQAKVIDGTITCEMEPFLEDILVVELQGSPTPINLESPMIAAANVPFKIVASVRHSSQHFTAYIRRNLIWHFYDDLRRRNMMDFPGCTRSQL